MRKIAAGRASSWRAPSGRSRTRIYIEKTNGPMLFELKATPVEYTAGPKRAIEAVGWCYTKAPPSSGSLRLAPIHLRDAVMQPTQQPRSVISRILARIFFNKAKSSSLDICSMTMSSRRAGSVLSELHFEYPGMHENKRRSLFESTQYRVGIRQLATATFVRGVNGLLAESQSPLRYFVRFTQSGADLFA
jgi:hypothetical protein